MSNSYELLSQRLNGKTDPIEITWDDVADGLRDAFRWGEIDEDDCVSLLSTKMADTPVHYYSNFLGDWPHWLVRETDFAGDF